jgi:transposase
MIRIDALWLATSPVDMRAGPERLLARVVRVFGAAQAHHGYLFANTRASRIKLLVHDGFGVWCAARRLNQGGFEWPRGGGEIDHMTSLERGGTNEFSNLTLACLECNRAKGGFPI